MRNVLPLLRDGRGVANAREQWKVLCALWACGGQAVLVGWRGVSLCVQYICMGGLMYLLDSTYMASSFFLPLLSERSGGSSLHLITACCVLFRVLRDWHGCLFLHCVFLSCPLPPRCCLWNERNVIGPLHVCPRRIVRLLLHNVRGVVRVHISLETMHTFSLFLYMWRM